MISAIYALIIFAISYFIVRKFYALSFLGDVPQSPAAVGRSFAAITFILGIALYNLHCIQTIIHAFVNAESIPYQAASVLASLFMAGVAGYLAARTIEDTQSMNAKIIAVVGYAPYLLVTTLALMGEPLWCNYVSAVLYIPAVIIGYFLYIKSPNKALKSDAERAGAV